MRHSPTFFSAVLLLLFLDGIPVTQGEEQPTPKDLSKIPPPGGAPLRPGRPGKEISVDFIKKATKRLEAAPADDLDKWVVELERLMDQKLDGDLARQACRTHFVTRLSVAFDDLKWNAKTADKLFHRAEAMKTSDVKVWKDAFEALLKAEIGQTSNHNYDGGPAYAVPLVLIPVEPLFDRWKYNDERGKKYLTRMKQLTADDVLLWYEADEFEGTRLDATVNIILLDDYFDNEKFQRDKFKDAIKAPKN